MYIGYVVTYYACSITKRWKILKYFRKVQKNFENFKKISKNSRKISKALKNFEKYFKKILKNRNYLKKFEKMYKFEANIRLYWVKNH